MTVDVYYCCGCVPLFVSRDYTLLIKYLCVTWCGSVPLDCSYVLLWIDIVVFYFFVLIALKTINNLLEIIIS
jgi:hypothetical protein